LSRTAIFGDVGGYFFGNFRDKTITIIIMAICYTLEAWPLPVIDCKVNDLEWLFHDKIRFRPALLDSESTAFSKIIA